MYPDGTYENRPTTCWTTRHGNARSLRSEIRSTSISCHKPIRTQQFSNTKASKTSLIAILQASKSACSWNRSCSDFHNARKGANYTLHAMFMLSIKGIGSRRFMCGRQKGWSICKILYNLSCMNVNVGNAPCLSMRFNERESPGENKKSIQGIRVNRFL